MKKVLDDNEKTHGTKDTIDREDYYNIRQNAHYNPEGKAAPDNNLFWLKRSNPLSSKGN